MADYNGAIPAFEVGAAFTGGWLSLSDGGESLVPVENQIYLVQTGEYKRSLVTWNDPLYRRVGKVGIKGKFSRVELPSTTHTSGYNGQLWSSSSTVYKNIVTVTRDMYELEISANCTSKSGGGIVLELGNTTLWSPGAVGSWSTTVRLNQPADEGKLLRLQFWGTSMTSLPSRVGANATVIARRGFMDFDTYDYVPSTETSPGQSGLVPSVAAGSNGQALVSSEGWSDNIITLNEEDIDAIFDNATPSSYQYAGDEFVIGNYIDKTLYRKKFDGSWVGSVAVGLSDAVKIIDVALRTTNGTINPQSAELSNGQLVISTNSAETIVDVDVDYTKE